MEPLTSTQRKYLRGLSHSLRPAVQVGKDGLTDNVITAIEQSLTAHELIKVRLAADRQGRQMLSAEIEKRTGCACAGLIGTMAVFYRRHPDPEKRKITLP